MSSQLASAPTTHSWQAAAALIDHSVIRSDHTRDDVLRFCREALNYRFATVFVLPGWVSLAAAALQGSPVRVGSVVGFPQGADLTSVKRFQAEELLRLGAQELDMVLNIGALKSGLSQLVLSDIRGVAEIAHAGGAILKVILETGMLTLEEKRLACELSLEARADFVKTSTGLLSTGATVEDVALLRSLVGQRAGVKAAGGIRNAAAFCSLLQAGANRFGTSAGVAIVGELGAPSLR